MTLDTVERLLRRADLLSANKQLLLASRLIDRMRQTNKPMTGKNLLASGVIGLWENREDIGDSLAYVRKLRAQAQTRSHS